MRLNSFKNQNLITVAVLPTVMAISTLFGNALAGTAPGETPDQFWRKNIDPLLDKKCLKCHAGVKQYGGLDLRSLETMLRGGEHGSAIIPGKPVESRILQYVQPNSDPHMPPDPKRQLTPEEIANFRKWVAMLPAPKSKLASGTSKDTSWVAEYLADYRRDLQTPKSPPKGVAGSAAIDWLLEADWKRDGIKPAPICDDRTFARRIYLDVAGRIPTSAELTQFLAERGRDKRTSLVDRLLASAEFPQHMREIFDTVLMGRANNRASRDRVDKGWNAYLEAAFKQNRPWNQIVRDIIVAHQGEGDQNGAVWFLAERKNNHQSMAEAVAPVVFGMQIKCAQCHNHPLVWEIEQRHYYGLVAAFNRSKNVDTEHGIGVGETATGGFINFSNLKKESQPANLVFLNGKSVMEQIPGPDEKEADTPDLYVVPPVKDGAKITFAPVPKFSRREAFADTVTKDNPMLAKAFANRVWNILLGRGIVQPVDQIDSRHPASHPDLLEWLAKDFEANGYDIQRCIRQIVLSRAYQLDSRSPEKTPSLPESFARALDKPLSAEQLFHSLYVAAGAKPDDATTKTLERTFVVTFPDLLPDTYAPSLQQALFLTNSPVLDDLLRPAPGNTASELVAMKDNPSRVRAAFDRILGRLPDTSELQQCSAMLDSQPGEKGVRNLLWALLTSVEFKVSH